ncbi:MAG TPA: hypothetical protein VLL75_05975 [Vicinamibacteria bacterium]|nr:hypothetical protein [Vicinamibacteria bacterium]
MEPLAAAFVLAGLVLAVLVGYALAAIVRPSSTAAHLGRLQETLDHVARTQDALRLEAQRARGDARVGLAGATQDLQGRLAQAQRALAEVKALEQARPRDGQVPGPGAHARPRRV